MKADINLPKRATYRLRRPLCLWRADQELRQIIPYCERNRIDDVMWFFEPTPFNKGLLTIAETAAYVLFLKKAKKALAEIGVTCSVNVFNTFGHRIPARDPHVALKHFDPLADWRGQRSEFWPCPFSPAYREWLSKHYATLAEAEPYSIWVDDDFRYLPRAGLDYTCYCPLHLKLFAAAIGKSGVSRKSLVEAVFAPGEPHPWRTIWLEVLNRGLVETAALIEQSVHSVSPRTRIAQMTSAFFLHETEGRDYQQVLKTFSGSHRPMVRISLSGYQEKDLRAFYSQDENIRHALACLPENTERCSEVDNHPHSLYCKSAKWLEGQMRHCCLLNVPHQTLAIQDQSGTDPDQEPEIGAMLRRTKPQLDAIAGLFTGNVRFRGVRLLCHPDMARVIHLQHGERGPSHFASMGTGWADALRAFGFPIVFTGAEAVTAMTGQILRAFRDDLDGIFSRGVLLDYSALETLRDLGRADLAGVTPLRRHDHRKDGVIFTEKLTDHRLAEVHRAIGMLKLHRGARVISEFWTNNEKPAFPAVTLFENKLGGRCCVYAQDFAGQPPDMFQKPTAPNFYNLTRRDQLRQVIFWLAKGAVPLCVDTTGWVSPHRADGADKIILAAMNLNLDAWEDVKLKASISQAVRRLLVLDKNHRFSVVPSECWQQRKGLLEIQLCRRIPTFEASCFLAEIKGSRGAQPSK